MTQQMRDEIYEKCLLVDFVINKNGTTYPARLIGRKCDFPAVYGVDKLGHEVEAQINWTLAKRIADGEVKEIFY